MCVTLSEKLGKELGQKRHCPGVNGRMAAWSESIKPAELVSGLEDRLIVVAVAVVAVAVSGISWVLVRGGCCFCDELAQGYDFVVCRTGQTKRIGMNTMEANRIGSTFYLFLYKFNGWTKS